MRGRKRHRKKLKQQILREMEAHLRQEFPSEDLTAILREIKESLDRLLYLAPRQSPSSPKVL